jgi:hypothetical protein
LPAAIAIERINGRQVIDAFVRREPDECTSRLPALGTFFHTRGRSN